MQRSIRAALIAGVILAGVVASPVAAAPPKGGVGDAVQFVNSEYRAYLAFARGVASSIGVQAGQLTQDQLLDATEQMQPTNMSFNLQHLLLQQQMQHENAFYTAISAIMKTKHDSVKNSISNVR